MPIWCWSVTFVDVQIVPEDSGAEVSDESPSKLAALEVTTMLQQGRSEGACKKLADELCNEVERNVQNFQQEIAEFPDGSECQNKGQDEVEKSRQEVNRTQTEYSEAGRRAEEASRAPVDFGVYILSTLDESVCGQFWDDPAYRAAKGNAEAAEEASREAEIAWNSATERLQESILRAAKKERECLCKVRMDYNSLYSTATEDRKNEAKAYAKCNHMNCYLKNTPAGNCKFVVPTVKQKKLANGVPEQECTPEPSKEVLGTAGTNVCPDGSVLMTTEAECSSAATALCKVLKIVSGSYRPTTPKACYIIQANGDVYWNAHETGAPHSQATPICATAE